MKLQYGNPEQVKIFEHSKRLEEDLNRGIKVLRDYCGNDVYLKRCFMGFKKEYDKLSETAKQYKDNGDNFYNKHRLKIRLRHKKNFIGSLVRFEINKKYPGFISERFQDLQTFYI